MTIFYDRSSMIAMILLLIVGAWDLVKKEIPVVLLCGLSMIALYRFIQSAFWEQVYGGLMALTLGITGLLPIKNKQLGSGDVWVLICLVLFWPIDVFWKSVSYAIVVLCIVSMGVWIVTENEKYRIPMVPFLLLGYWM